MKLIKLSSLCLTLFLLGNLSAFAQDSIRKEATWVQPDATAIVSAFESWLKDSRLEAKSAALVREYVRSTDWNNGELIDRVMPGLELGDSDVARFVELLASAQSDEKVQTSNLLDNPSTNSFIKDHVRLLYGRWLARNELFDESLAQLKQLAVKDVLDPATLLYYRGLMEHQLLKPKACIKTLNQLLENTDHLPRRYAVLARLMLADMERLEKDSLDEISRMMGDIRRRTDLKRSGTRVRDKEEDVIKRLDKLIKRLEEQQRKMQMAQAQGTPRPTSPADREQRLSGQGTGDVKSRKQVDGGQWGNLDPTERDAALAEMSKDLPPHYRSVIEEYFKKLAEQTEKRE